MSGFLSALKKFGIEALKIGQYVLLGVQGAQAVQQQVAPSTSTGTDFLSRLISIIKGIEVTGQAASQLAGSTVLTGPQKLAAGTALIAQELSSLNVGGAVLKDAALFAKSAAGFAQATVDYLQAFDEGAVSVIGSGTTTSSIQAVAAASVTTPTAVS